MIGTNRAKEFRGLARAVIEADEALGRYEGTDDEPPASLIHRDRDSRDALIGWLTSQSVNDVDPVVADEEFVAALALQSDGLIVVRRSQVVRVTAELSHRDPDT